MLTISIYPDTTTIIGDKKFFSAFGAYKVSGMEIITRPGAKDVYMNATFERKGIRN